MGRDMFTDICRDVEAANEYFKLGYDATKQPGFHPIQKVTAAVRVLAYGGAADSLDEYIRMGESTVIETVNHFTRTIVSLYADEYLREPTANDISRLLSIAEERGFPGMLGSIDCMHWEWEKCPTAWHGQYWGHFKKPTIILEAVASYDLWIWHAFFGMPGSCNDINVLNRSHVFDSISSGYGPQVDFKVNGKDYHMGYYLADGIYPPWATLISGVPSPVNMQQQHFTLAQAAYRKDVEMMFGKLQGKYHIVKGPARVWCPEDMRYIILCVVILHNMGIKYERGPGLAIQEYEGSTEPRLSNTRNVPEISALIENHRRIRSRAANAQLKEDLIEHLWIHDGHRRVQQ